MGLIRRLAVAAVAVSALAVAVWLIARDDAPSEPAAAAVGVIEVRIDVPPEFVTFEGAIVEAEIRAVPEPGTIDLGPLLRYRGRARSATVAQELGPGARGRFRVTSTVRDCGGSCFNPSAPQGRCAVEIDAPPAGQRRIVTVVRTSLRPCAIRVAPLSDG